MARGGIHWIAGPVSYNTTDTGMYPDRTSRILKWGFIGGDASGELRRWNLLFSLETRKFSSTSLSIPQWEKAHAKDLADFYRPIAILRHMLPKGSIALAMKTMLKQEDIADAIARSITGGQSHGDHS